MIDSLKYSKLNEYLAWIANTQASPRHFYFWFSEFSDTYALQTLFRKDMTLTSVQVKEFFPECSETLSALVLTSLSDFWGRYSNIQSKAFDEKIWSTLVESEENEKHFRVIQYLLEINAHRFLHSGYVLPNAENEKLYSRYSGYIRLRIKLLTAKMLLNKGEFEEVLETLSEALLEGRDFLDSTTLYTSYSLLSLAALGSGEPQLCNKILNLEAIFIKQLDHPHYRLGHIRRLCEFFIQTEQFSAAESLLKLARLRSGFFEVQHAFFVQLEVKLALALGQFGDAKKGIETLKELHTNQRFSTNVIHFLDEEIEHSIYTGNVKLAYELISKERLAIEKRGDLLSHVVIGIQEIKLKIANKSFLDALIQCNELQKLSEQKKFHFETADILLLKGFCLAKTEDIKNSYEAFVAAKRVANKLNLKMREAASLYLSAEFRRTGTGLLQLVAKGPWHPHLYNFLSPLMGTDKRVLKVSNNEGEILILESKLAHEIFEVESTVFFSKSGLLIGGKPDNKKTTKLLPDGIIAKALKILLEGQISRLHKDFYSENENRTASQFRVTMHRLRAILKECHIQLTFHENDGVYRLENVVRAWLV